MTVCIAAICSWNYAEKGSPPNIGRAVLTLSDRMITVGDTEYEPNQQKLGPLTSSSWVLIAGDYSIHSQAILDTRKHVGANAYTDTHNVAIIYGRSLQKIKLRAAEDEILAPLGLNTDTFIAQQRELSPSLVDSLATQLQNYGGEHIEAIVVGMDGAAPGLYYIDNKGTAHCFNDVGFAAVGAGAWHAKSQLMQARYVNTAPFVHALAITYAAKKAAEVAPGVGKETDIHIALPTGIQPLFHRTKARLEELFGQYEMERQPLVERGIEQLNAFIIDPKTYESLAPAKQASDAGNQHSGAGAPETSEASSPTAPEQPPEQSGRAPQE